MVRNQSSKRRVAMWEGFMFRPFMLAGALVALSLHPAASQQPTQAQRDAIRASCRSDFMANCASVTPGGKEALECLLRNQAKLSPACNSAVSAIAAPAAAPVPAAQAPAPSAPAAAELAASTKPAAASPAAQAPSAPSERKPTAAKPSKKSTAARETTPPPPVSAPPAESARPTDAQKSAIRAACRSDFMANCSGVQPGGAAALRCLQSKSAKLSASCQSAVAAIGGGGPPASAASSSAAPAASAPTPAVAPLGPILPMPPREALGILAMCRVEQQTICGGVPFGGGRVLNCLADHAPQLSSQCYEALARATR
jgi:hypothetical protein